MRGVLAAVLIASLALPTWADQHNEAAARRKERARTKVPEGVTLVQDLEYARVDETPLLLDLYRPTNVEGRPPLIVWVHGGGWRAGNKERTQYVWLAQAGYALASINYRLSNKAKFPAQIHDCKSAIRWLRANADPYGYDATRIGVAGSSAGGHLVALLGTGADVAALEGGVGGNLTHSSRVQAVVDLFGPADLARMPDNPTRKRAGPVALLLGGHPADRPDLATLASPITHVTSDDAPFLILHGDQDRLVPVEQSRVFDARLDAAGVESALHVLEGSGHGGRGFNSAEMRTVVLQFFDRHIKRTTAAVTSPRAPADRTVLGTFSKKGPHAFGVCANTVLRDGVRDKDLSVRVTYPLISGSVPVIVWSHGAFGSKDRYAPLVEHWASHGYAVIQANHEDSMALTGGRPDITTFARWAERPKDITLLIDSLRELEKGLEGFAGTLDATHLGVGGHSFGAHTAQLIGGVTTRSVPGGGHESHADARVKAVMLLSAQGRGEALDETSWNGLTRPALVITGTKDDSGRTGKPYTWRIEPYTYAPPGDKTFVLLRDAHHGFGGVTGPGRRGRASGPDNPSHVDAVRATSLLFWDTYLKGDLGAKMLLRSRRITKESDRAVRVQFK